MMNRYLSRKLIGLAFFLLATTACVEPIKTTQPDAGDSYSISFHIQTQDDDFLTKAGPLSGVDAVVTSLYMYCFDANGRYLGRYQATVTKQEQTPYTSEQTPGEFKGEIPPATARIHFVANADCPVGGDYIGMTEDQVMHESGLVSRSIGNPMAYWGYLRRSTANEVAVLFDEDITDQTVTIWMVRDRAQIVAGNYKKRTERSTPGDGSFYDDISWVVYNGLSKGHIAMYGYSFDDSNPPMPIHDADSPYKELTETNLSSISEVTPFDEEGGRFKTTEADMVPFDKEVTGYEPMYVFDDLCPYHTPSLVTKIIVKATFNVTGIPETDHAQHTRFFPLCVTHGFDSESIPLKRGHVYQLSLQTLPEAAGYTSFEGAAAAQSFVNGALVDIPQKVIEVSDGAFNMRVNYQLQYPLSGEYFYSTAVLLQNDASTVKIPFEVIKEGPADREFDFSESAWIKQRAGTTQVYSSATVTWGTGIDDDNQHAKIGTGDGYTNPLNTSVTFSLADVEEDELKESVYNLKGFYTTKKTVDEEEYEIKNILMRNIDVFSIDRFRIQEAYNPLASTDEIVYTENLALESLGDSKYRLKFKLPGSTVNEGDHDKYPEVLYPLQVKFATRTLQPTKIYINGVEQENAVFGVQVRSTVPNTQPAMLSAQDNATQWNYQSSDNYWNFWYTYPIVSVPRYNGKTGEIQTGTDGEEIIGPEIWVDFKDVRSPSVFQKIPVNVGLYLYIEYFGAANAVSFDAAYVKATGVIVHRVGETENGTANSNGQRYLLSRNTTLQLETTVFPTNATNSTITNVTWESSNSNRATVNTDGLVTASTNNTGNVYITATVTTVDGTFTDRFYITVY